MRQSSPVRRLRGFTLVELLVVIAIIGTLVALLLPAVQNAREAARNNTCKNNMRQLALALTNYDSNQSKLPGYINDIENVRGGKDSSAPFRYSQARQASWIVMLFPYLENSAVYDNWTDFSTNLIPLGNTPEIAILECPSDAPEIPGAPWLSYVGNSGQLSTGQSAANGVFLDLSTNTNAIPSSAKDGREDDPKPQMSMNYISSNDGASNTVMVSESLYSFYWTYTDASSVGDVGSPVANSTEKGTLFKDHPKWFGFTWSNAATGNFINGVPNDSDAANIQTMSEMDDVHAFPSSNHPGGVNMAFGDARVEYINETIDPTIYGQLMTTNARRSNYAPGGVADRKLPPVSSDQF